MNTPHSKTAGPEPKVVCPSLYRSGSPIRHGRESNRFNSSLRWTGAGRLLSLMPSAAIAVGLWLLVAGSYGCDNCSSVSESSAKPISVVMSNSTKTIVIVEATSAPFSIRDATGKHWDARLSMNDFLCSECAELCDRHSDGVGRYAGIGIGESLTFNWNGLIYERLPKGCDCRGHAKPCMRAKPLQPGTYTFDVRFSHQQDKLKQADGPGFSIATFEQKRSFKVKYRAT